MLTAESLPANSPTTVDIAIVGAGAVGVAIARRLAGRGCRVALLEAGGAQFEPKVQDLFFTGSPRCAERHPPANLYRRRMLGGTTSVWGGRCIPFDPEDFTPKAGLPGWPVGYDEVNAYVPEALAFLLAGNADFDVGTALPGVAFPHELAESDLQLDRIERFSEPTQVWRRWGATLAAASDVITISNAACTEITTDASTGHTTGVIVRTRAGDTRAIAAARVILACGGLETPRLLLNSAAHRSCAIGNEHDMVGRCYMTHIFGDIAVLRLADPTDFQRFDYSRTPDGVYARRLLLLKRSARERARLGNIVFRPSISAVSDARHRDAILSAIFVTKSLIAAEYVRSLVGRGAAPDGSAHAGLAAHVGNIARGLPRLAGFGFDWMRRRVFASRKLPSVFLDRADGLYPLEFDAEQSPHLASRVQLGPETDPFGMRRLDIRWDVRDDDVLSITRACRLLADAVALSGLGEVKLGQDLENDVRAAIRPVGGHHMGTARMGNDPRTSVVDPNAEVWGTKGLYIAGAPIFPTGGFASPTLTAVALALRLADHVLAQRSMAGAGNVAAV